MKKLIYCLLVVCLAFVVTSCGDKEPDGEFMSYAEYDAAKVGDKVTVRAYVQAKQSWWDNKAIVYAQNDDGAYLFYNLVCTEDEYNTALANGNYIEVSGSKAEYRGEIEIGEGCTFKALDRKAKIYAATDVTAKFGNNEELIKYQNQFVSFKNLKVVAKNDPKTGDEKAFFYAFDNSGDAGRADIYFDVTDGKNTATFTIESYLCDGNSDAYKAAEALVIGQSYDFEAFAYWYDGLSPHVVSIKAAK